MPRIPDLLERLSQLGLVEAQQIAESDPDEFVGIKRFLCDCSLEEIMELGCQCGGH